MNGDQDQSQPKSRRRLLPPLRKDSAYGRNAIHLPGVIARIVVFAIVPLFLVGFVIAGLTNVGPTERAVVFHGSSGDLSILSPGKFQWVTPILNDVTTYNVRSDIYTETAEGIAKDQQVVTTEVTVLYHPDVKAVQTIHQRLGPDYEDKVLVPAVQDSVKSAVNNYEVEELRGDVRAQVKQEIVDRITEALESQDLVVDRISLTDFDFSEPYNRAIEEAAVEERNVVKARATQERASIEANTTLIQAHAQAEAARLLAATQSDVFFSLEWLKKWDGHLPDTLVQGEAGGVLLAPNTPQQG